MPPVINKEKCSGCGICSDICPEDVIGVPGDIGKPVVLYPEECWHCAACVLDCPKEAVKMYIRLPMRLFKEVEVSIPCITPE